MLFKGSVCIRRQDRDTIPEMMSAKSHSVTCLRMKFKLRSVMQDAHAGCSLVSRRVAFNMHMLDLSHGAVQKWLACDQQLVDLITPQFNNHIVDTSVQYPS